MKRSALTKKTKSTLFIVIGIGIIIAAAAIFLLAGQINSVQAEAPIIAGVSFCGEYRIGDGAWRPIVEGEHISSTKGDVYLRGFFQISDPITEEPICPAPPGQTVALYFNHIRATIRGSSGETVVSDAENEYFGEDACAAMWGNYTVTENGPLTDSNIVTIVLHNPHIFGNENAVDEFLENLSLAPGIYLDTIMLEKGQAERNIGLAIFIASLMILGIALFSTFVHIKYDKAMWLAGLMALSASGYFLFDAFAVSRWNASNIVNTRMLGLSMMFYILFTSALIVTFLTGKAKKVAFGVTVISGLVILGCIAASVFGVMKFFDTWLYWAIFEVAAIPVLIACMIMGFKNASASQKLFYFAGIFALSSFPIDAAATTLGWWEGGLISKHIFLLIFVMMLVIALRIIPDHINSAMKARELEVEQKNLKLELQESRISIMLSQMQPHFIFNTLNTIYHLCEINPDTARKTISYFSEYLRNNIDNLGRSEMISFEKELSFVKTYLDIEKVRFDDELDITMDIETTNFKLPVLTIQPIVENAVKHGTSKKKGMAQLFISTKETEACYEITIKDTGVGFDPQSYTTDGHKHIGISSVRQRLENLCDGTLDIESAVGVGTTAVIRIPKKEELKS